ncbi:MAG: PEP-CTERM sorting domain-containing protein [Acidobacteriia bacterium]|nr:PEP-CTERM sorting domain-containing protein [Terriglobia bacterium]
MRRLAALSLIALAVLILGMPAYAGPILRLTDVTKSIQIAIGDNTTLDLDPTVGVITISVNLANQTLFPGSTSTWTVNATTGLTKPYQGTAIVPSMDLNSVDAKGPGTLVIEFTDTDFGPLPVNYSYVGDIGGTTVGKVSYNAYLDPGNVAFAPTVSLFGIGPFGPGGFNGTGTSGALTAAFPYSITQLVTIVHTTTGTSSFDATLTAVPEPSALLLLGSGLAALGVWRLRKRN